MKKTETKSKRAKKEEKTKNKPIPKKKTNNKTKKEQVTYGQETYENPYEYFIYARVSKKDKNETVATIKDDLDGEKETSIKSQVDTMRSIARQRGIKIEEKNILKENVSGKKGIEREKFEEMMKKLNDDAKIHKGNMQQRKYGGVLFRKLDRLARNFRDFARIDELMDLGYEFISATETIQNTYTGRLLFRILAGFATYESEKLSARAGFGFIKNLMAKEFYRLGGKRLIFGYKFSNDKKLIIQDEEKVALIKEIYSCYAEQKEIFKQEAFMGINAMDLTIGEIEKKYGTKIEKYIKESKSVTTVENFISNILENKQQMKYNGYIDAELDVKDEIVQNLFLEVQEKYKEYENLVLKGTGQVGTKIQFRFFFPELEIIKQEQYDWVQKELKVINGPIKNTIVGDGDRKDEGLFHSLVYFQNKHSLREGHIYYKKEKETRHYRTEASLDEDNKGEIIKEEISEGKLEDYIWRNGLLDNIGRLKNQKERKNLLKLLQVRQNMYEMTNMTKYIGNVRAYEMQLNRLKMQRNAALLSELKEIKNLYSAIDHTEELLAIAHKNLRKEEAVNLAIANSFEEIIKPSLYAEKAPNGERKTNINRKEDIRVLKSLAYRFMMEKIVINKQKNTIQVHFYQEIAKALGHQGTPVVTIQLPKG